MAHCSNVKCLWRLTVVDKLLEYCLCCWRKQNISQSSVHNFKRNYVNNTLWINWFGKKYLSDDYITKWCRFKIKKKLEQKRGGIWFDCSSQGIKLSFTWGGVCCLTDWCFRYGKDSVKWLQLLFLFETCLTFILAPIWTAIFVGRSLWDKIIIIITSLYLK